MVSRLQRPRRTKEGLANTIYFEYIYTFVYDLMICIPSAYESSLRSVNNVFFGILKVASHFFELGGVVLLPNLTDTSTQEYAESRVLACFSNRKTPEHSVICCLMVKIHGTYLTIQFCLMSIQDIKCTMTERVLFYAEYLHPKCGELETVIGKRATMIFEQMAAEHPIWKCPLSKAFFDGSDIEKDSVQYLKKARLYLELASSPVISADVECALRNIQEMITKEKAY
jgi:hypothetical protein